MHPCADDVTSAWFMKDAELMVYVWFTLVLCIFCDILNLLGTNYLSSVYTTLYLKIDIEFTSIFP